MCKSCNVCPIPCLLTILPFISHSLSFYKEELVGETKNYIHNRAGVTNKDVDTVVLDVIDEIVRIVNTVRDILQGEKEKAIWETWLKSYNAFHFMTSRYKLTELLDGESVLF